MLKNINVPRNLSLKYHEVPTGGLDFKFSSVTKELDAALLDILGESPVYEVDLAVIPVDQMVHINGSLSGQLLQTCSRCAEEFRSPFKKNFFTAYYKSEESIKGISGGLGGSLENLEGSFDLEYLDGNEINLAEAVHEQMALEVPFQPLCSESCQGLCLECGTNLNLEKCECTKNNHAMTEKASPFSVLKELRGE